MTDVQTRVRDAVAWLERRGSARAVLEMRTRYGIVTEKAFGCAMGDVQKLAKQLGRDHDLAAALWATGVHEARCLAAFVDDPARVTSAQMDRWARDFDNWGVCDTLCFVLFDRTPHAWSRIGKWATRKDEFVRRAAFALLASVALHDRTTGDAPFLASLALVERAAPDERNFVKKGVSWALRAVGRRSAALNAASVELARRLAASPEPAARWIGRDALRDLTSAAAKKRLAARRAGGHRTRHGAVGRVARK